MNEPKGYDEWLHDTRIIRTWVSGGAVSIEHLVADLRRWADFMEQLGIEDVGMGGSVEIGGEVMTEAQYNAAVFPFTHEAPEAETWAESLDKLVPGQEPYIDPPDLSPDAETRKFDVT